MSLKENVNEYFHINEFRDNVVKFVEAKVALVKIDFEEKIEDAIVKVVYVAVFSIFRIRNIDFFEHFTSYFSEPLVAKSIPRVLNCQLILRSYFIHLDFFQKCNFSSN